MHRLSLHRGPVLVAGPALILLALALPAMAAFATEVPAEPTVSFVGGDLAPVACTATPDVASLIVLVGTRVTLANFTGADATVDVGAAQPIEVADGTAISIRLGRGEHVLTMVPKCLQTYGLVPVSISVRKSKDMPATAGPSGTPTASPSTDGRTGTTPPTGQDLDPAGLTQPVASPSSRPSARPGSPADVGDPAASGRTDLGQAEPGEVDLGLDIQAASAARPRGISSDGRGRRLLALVATICVFGVTSAIIRAIVAQRTTRALDPR